MRWTLGFSCHAGLFINRHTTKRKCAQETYTLNWTHALLRKCRSTCINQASLWLILRYIKWKRIQSLTNHPASKWRYRHASCRHVCSRPPSSGRAEKPASAQSASRKWTCKRHMPHGRQVGDFDLWLLNRELARRSYPAGNVHVNSVFLLYTFFFVFELGGARTGVTGETGGRTDGQAVWLALEWGYIWHIERKWD